MLIVISFYTNNINICRLVIIILFHKCQNSGKFYVHNNKICSFATQFLSILSMAKQLQKYEKYKNLVKLIIYKYK